LAPARTAGLPLLFRTIEHDGPFPVRQVSPGHVGADAELAGDLRLHVEPEHLPGDDGAVVDAHALVADERGVVDLADRADALTRGAGTGAVEGERLRTGGLEGHVAVRARERLLLRDQQG